MFITMSKFLLAMSSTLPSSTLAPMNSPTIAPTTASVEATFMPPKTRGSALGRRILKNMPVRLAPIERARWILPVSTDFNPFIVPMRRQASGTVSGL